MTRLHHYPTAHCESSVRFDFGPLSVEALESEKNAIRKAPPKFSSSLQNASMQYKVIYEETQVQEANPSDMP